MCWGRPCYVCFFLFFPRPEIKISVILQQLAALSSRVFSFNCAPSQLYLFFFFFLSFSLSPVLSIFFMTLPGHAHSMRWNCRPIRLTGRRGFSQQMNMNMGCRLTHFLNADICGHITSLAYRALRADGRQALDKCQTLNIFLALPTDPLRCLSPKHFPVM